MDNAIIINQTVEISNNPYMISEINSNKYYIPGIMFMICVMGVLIYVNFFYEYTLTQIVTKIVNFKIFYCFREFIFKCSLICRLLSDSSIDENNIPINHNNVIIYHEK